MKKKEKIILVMMFLLVGVMVGCNKGESGGNTNNSGSSKLIGRQGVGASTTTLSGSHDEILAVGQVYGCPGIRFEGRGKTQAGLYTNIAPWARSTHSERQQAILRRRLVLEEEKRKIIAEEEKKAAEINDSCCTADTELLLFSSHDEAALEENARIKEIDVEIEKLKEMGIKVALGTAGTMKVYKDKREDCEDWIEWYPEMRYELEWRNYKEIDINHPQFGKVEGMPDIVLIGYMDMNPNVVTIGRRGKFSRGYIEGWFPVFGIKGQTYNINGEEFVG